MIYILPHKMSSVPHPSRSKTKRSQCLGFSREHRRCRLEQEEGSKTCHIHRNYYPDWFLNHHGFYDITTLTPRQQKEYTFQLGGGHVIPTEQYIINLTLNMRGYYIFLVEVAKINPLLNRRIFSDIIARTVDDQIFYNRIERQTPTRDLKKILTAPETCQYALEGILTRISLYTSSNTIQIDRDLFIASIMEIFEETQWGWKQILHSYIVEECFAAHVTLLTTQGANAFNDGDFEERDAQRALLYCRLIKEQLIQKMNTWSRGVRDSIQPLKGDLMAAAWKPERVEKWMEAGLDVSDM